MKKKFQYVEAANPQTENDELALKIIQKGSQKALNAGLKVQQSTLPDPLMPIRLQSPKPCSNQSCYSEVKKKNQKTNNKFVQKIPTHILGSSTFPVHNPSHHRNHSRQTRNRS